MCWIMYVWSSFKQRCVFLPLKWSNNESYGSLVLASWDTLVDKKQIFTCTIWAMTHILWFRYSRFVLKIFRNSKLTKYWSESWFFVVFDQEYSVWLLNKSRINDWEILSATSSAVSVVNIAQLIKTQQKMTNRAWNLNFSKFSDFWWLWFWSYLLAVC